MAGLVRNTVYKEGYSFEANNFQHVRNGIAGILDTAGTIPAGTYLLEIGNQGSSGLIFGTIKNLRIWSRRLPDEILQILTRP
jgi:hypothetical protein